MSVYVLPTVLATGLAILFVGAVCGVFYLDHRHEEREQKPPRWHAAFKELIAATENWQAHRGPIPALAAMDVQELVLGWLITQAGPAPLYDEAAWAAYTREAV